MRKFVVSLVVLSFLLVPAMALADEKKPINFKNISFSEPKQAGMSVEEYQWAEELKVAQRSRSGSKMLAYFGAGVGALGMVATLAVGGSPGYAIGTGLIGVVPGGFFYMNYRSWDKKVKHLEANRPVRRPGGGFDVSLGTTTSVAYRLSW